MDPSPLLYAGAGLATLAAAMLPRLLDRAPISMPMLFLGAGALTFAVVEPLPDPDPHLHGTVLLHLTESRAGRAGQVLTRFPRESHHVPPHDRLGG